MHDHTHTYERQRNNFDKEDYANVRGKSADVNLDSSIEPCCEEENIAPTATVALTIKEREPTDNNNGIINIECDQCLRKKEEKDMLDDGLRN